MKIPKISSINPKELTAAKINKELDKLDSILSDFTDEFIKLGRGNERHSDICKKNDKLSKDYIMVCDRRSKLRMEVESRYGGYISRLPKGFNKIK